MAVFAPCSDDGVGDRVEDGDAVTSWPALPGVTPATTAVP